MKSVVSIKVVCFCIKIIVKLIRPKFDFHRYHLFSLEVPQPTGPCARSALGLVSWAAHARPKKPYLRMSNFDLAF